MTLAPIVINTDFTPQPVFATTPAVVGIVAEKVSGGSAASNTPTAVRTAAEATAAFGATSKILAACREIFAKSNAAVVGCVFDPNSDIPSRLAGIAAAITAIKASLSAPSAGFKPTILIAPGETYNEVSSAPVGTAHTIAALLNTMAGEMNAACILDAGPATRAVALAYNTANGGNRALIAAQTIKTGLVTALDGSSFLASELAKNDGDFGVYDSFSNRPVSNVVSVNPARSFDYLDQNSDAVTMRRSAITSIVLSPGEVGRVWRVIGGLVKVTGASNPLRYLGVRRGVDDIRRRLINLSVERYNRGMAGDFIDDLVSDANDVLDLLVSAGVLVSGTATAATSRNTETARTAGLAYLQASVLFPSINESITFDVQVGLGT